MAENVEAAPSSQIEEMVQELTQPEGATALVAEIAPAGATTDAGEASPLPEEEATPKAGEEPILPGEVEARETSTPQDLPKDSASLDLPDGKEVLIF